MSEKREMPKVEVGQRWNLGGREEAITGREREGCWCICIAGDVDPRDNYKHRGPGRDCCWEYETTILAGRLISQPSLSGESAPAPAVGQVWSWLHGEEQTLETLSHGQWFTREGNSFNLCRFTDGTLKFVRGPVEAPREPRPDRWRVGQRRRGKLAQCNHAVCGRERGYGTVEFTVARRWNGTQHDWLISVPHHAHETIGFDERWPSELLSEGAPQEAQDRDQYHVEGFGHDRDGRHSALVNGVLYRWDKDGKPLPLEAPQEPLRGGELTNVVIDEVAKFDDAAMEAIMKSIAPPEPCGRLTVTGFPCDRDKGHDDWKGCMVTKPAPRAIKPARTVHGGDPERDSMGYDSRLRRSDFCYCSSCKPKTAPAPWTGATEWDCLPPAKGDR